VCWACHLVLPFDTFHLEGLLVGEDTPLCSAGGMSPNPARTDWGAL
jgi:hypothetical protein